MSNYTEYYKKLVTEIAINSNDPNTKVGCLITDQDNKLLSTGYNSYPENCRDFTWEKNDDLDNKLLYVCHAEMNAIIKSKKDVTNGILYSTLFPCNECAKIIIQSGLKKVYYINIKDNKIQTKASKRMLDEVGIEYIQLN